MSVFLVARLVVNNWQQFTEYQRVAFPTIVPAGGWIVAAGPPVVLEGERPANHEVIVEFATEALARAWFEGSAYQASVPLRAECVSEVTVDLVAEVGGIDGGSGPPAPSRRFTSN